VSKPKHTALPEPDEPRSIAVVRAEALARRIAGAVLALDRPRLFAALDLASVNAPCFESAANVFSLVSMFRRRAGERRPHETIACWLMMHAHAAGVN